MRKIRSFVWALLLGLALGAGPAAADTSAGDKRAGKAKTGDACKTDADCDQSSRPQACVRSKCQVDVPPPPT